jgi:hypothetical protein
MSEAGESKPEGAVFLTVQYARQKGESIVYSGVLIAGALVLFGMPRAPILALIAALVSAGVAIYHWPYVAKDRKAFTVTPAGINIDRLGLLPWNAIAGVEIVDRYVRMIRNAELRIALKRPFDTAVEHAPQVGPVRRYAAGSRRSGDPAAHPSQYLTGAQPRRNIPTSSTWADQRNWSTGVTPSRRYPPSRSARASRAKVAGLQETETTTGTFDFAISSA